MRITIQASKALVTPEEVKSHVSTQDLKRLKGKVLVPYTVAEEGIYTPRVIGEGLSRLTWPRAVIRRIQATLQKGLKVFKGHNEDNSTRDRPPVGEIVASYLKEIGDKLRVIGIAAMDAVDAKKFDICSIEADIYESNGVVGDIDGITGLAVSNSEIDQPAFSNAKRMAVIQCFKSQEGPGDTGSKKKMPEEITLKDIMSAPISLLKEAIVNRQIHPNQIFTEKDVREDREFGKAFSEAEEMKKKVEETKKALEDKEKESKEAIRKNQEAEAKDKLGKLLPKTLTEKQKTFLMDQYDPSKMEKLDDASMEAYIKSGQEAFSKYAAMFSGESGESESHTEEAQGEKSDLDTLNDLFDK